jgi:hypothetical protein
LLGFSEGRIQRRALGAAGCTAIPELHASIVFEDLYDFTRHMGPTLELC